MAPWCCSDCWWKKRARAGFSAREQRDACSAGRERARDRTHTSCTTKAIAIVEPHAGQRERALAHRGSAVAPAPHLERAGAAAPGHTAPCPPWRRSAARTQRPPHTLARPAGAREPTRTDVELLATPSRSRFAPSLWRWRHPAVMGQASPCRAPTPQQQAHLVEQRRAQLRRALVVPPDELQVAVADEPSAQEGLPLHRLLQHRVELRVREQVRRHPGSALTPRPRAPRRSAHGGLPALTMRSQPAGAAERVSRCQG